MHTEKSKQKLKEELLSAYQLFRTRGGKAIELQPPANNEASGARPRNQRIRIFS